MFGRETLGLRGLEKFSTAIVESSAARPLDGRDDGGVLGLYTAGLWGWLGAVEEKGGLLGLGVGTAVFGLWRSSCSRSGNSRMPGVEGWDGHWGCCTGAAGPKIGGWELRPGKRADVGVRCDANDLRLGE